MSESSRTTANPAEEQKLDLFTEVINSLAFDLLNSVPPITSENVPEALDLLSLRIRRSALAITLALDRIANSIESASAPGE